MNTKIIEYGTEHKVKVLSANNKGIVVIGDDGEGYVLINHGIKELPREGDIGKITFVKNNTEYKGHWEYSKTKY